MPAFWSGGLQPSSSPLQVRRFHTAAASGALRTAPNAHFCHQFNCKLMTLQKFFENPKVPFCAECMLICNLNEILNCTWNMLKKRLLVLITVVVWYEFNLMRQVLMSRESLLESPHDTVILRTFLKAGNWQVQEMQFRYFPGHLPCSSPSSSPAICSL